MSPLIPSEDEVSAPSHPEPQVPPPGKFDLVLAHYSHSTIEKTTEWWSGFLDIEMVRSSLCWLFSLGFCHLPLLTLEKLACICTSM